MKAAWNQLGGVFASSATVVIGDVDCTVEKDLCSKHGVRGYPTIKYFTDATGPDGEDYKGGRELGALKAFADENLGPSCSPDNRDLCSEEQLKEIDDVLALPEADRDAQIAEGEAAIKDLEDGYKKAVEGLQKQYQELTEEKEKAVAALGPKMRLLKSVRGHSAKQEL
jgi:protein disulfide-isomerase A6